MSDSREIVVKLLIDPVLFGRQRATLCNIISSGIDTGLFTEHEAEVLDGIQGLCDEIADQAEDNYGINCRF